MELAQDNQKDFLHTRIFTFLLPEKKVSVLKIPATIPKSDFNSLLFDNKLYQVEFGKKSMSLGIMEFPSGKSISRFDYDETQPITIKTSMMVNTKGRVIEKDRNESKVDEKVISTMAQGSPYLTIARDGQYTLLEIGSHDLNTYSMYNGTGSTTYTKEDYYEFNACIENDTVPCSKPFQLPILDKIAQVFQVDKKSDKSDNIGTAENSNFIYTIQYTGKTKEYFIEEWGK
jgi:hypothetical protein